MCVCYNGKQWGGVPVKTIMEIKKGLEERIGERLKIKANGGRRKTIVRSGVLSETYPSVFVVELDQDEHSYERVSYSYADVLTETVELKFLDDQSKSS